MIQNNDYPFTIPAWVRWLAQDSTGIWWGYEAEPHRNDTGWYENEVGACIELGVTVATEWEQSLTRYNA